MEKMNRLNVLFVFLDLQLCFTPTQETSHRLVTVSGFTESTDIIEVQ
jgi:hypothetical protein